MGTLEELVGRRVRTPGVVFQVPGVYFLGRVKSVAREREDSLNLLYDDGGYYWFPRESVMRWLIDESEEDGNVSDDLEHEVDEDEEEESGRSRHDTATTLNDDHTPGLLKNFVKDKPADIEEGMWYVFKLLLPLREYWNVVSQYSLLYAETKKAGEDTNSEKPERKRHKRFLNKGKPRPFKKPWGEQKAPPTILGQDFRERYG
ncbi:hypothetical protein CYMTET_6079 [Cymbomonas tetramitiformis]|uniref:Uncharacterized protein n=1 Tax=Cymbomonas tetramitiformis TaxID=36881 RepID=A0AAE0LIF9_9CHLO|nr:hypothetical protein CYMTET_6079 [Cymbomonas tetramitiformis]